MTSVDTDPRNIFAENHFHNSKIFDLKTRATHAIRNSFRQGPKDMDPKDRYKAFVHYKIDRQQGLFNSFEREMYDMIRSAFIKYSLQLRIGRCADHCQSFLVSVCSSAEPSTFQSFLVSVSSSAEPSTF